MACVRGVSSGERVVWRVAVVSEESVPSERVWSARASTQFVQVVWSGLSRVRSRVAERAGETAVAGDAVTGRTTGEETVGD